jgi:pilus assembly protein Flp/PilA
MKRFLRDETAATAIEYALIAGLIAMAIVGGATMIGTSLRGSYNQVSSGFTNPP